MALSNLPGIRVAGNRYGGARQRTADGGHESKEITEIEAGPTSPVSLDTDGCKKTDLRTLDSKKDRHLYQNTKTTTLIASAKLLAACNMLTKPRKRGATKQNNGRSKAVKSDT